MTIGLAGIKFAPYWTPWQKIPLMIAHFPNDWICFFDKVSLIETSLQQIFIIVSDIWLI
jgi:hypothetical protein